jgi:hypothetical protein
VSAPPTRAARRVLQLRNAVVGATEARDLIATELERAADGPGTARRLKKSQRMLERLARQLSGATARTTPKAIELACLAEAEHAAIAAEARAAAAARNVKQRAASREAMRQGDRRRARRIVAPSCVAEPTIPAQRMSASAAARG